MSPSSVVAVFAFLFSTFLNDSLQTGDTMKRRLNIDILLKAVRTACVVSVEHSVLAPENRFGFLDI